MPDTPLLQKIRSFSDFTALPADAGEDLVRRAEVRAVPSNLILGTQGSPCDFFPLVLSGRARIFAMDENGREITLYRLGPGEGCVLAAACSVSRSPLPGFSIVETKGDALFLPAEDLRELVDLYRFWRDYVFSLVGRQLGRVVAVTNDLAFRRLDARIAGFLLDATASEMTVKATHQAIAQEVGTRREVVSRILKGFEKEGLVSLHRGVVQVLDEEALSRRRGPSRRSSLPV